MDGADEGPRDFACSEGWGSEGCGAEGRGAEGRGPEVETAAPEPSRGALRKRAERARRRYERRDYLHKVSAVQRLCRRLEAGLSVAEACREPTLPARATLMYWVAHDAELRTLFDEAVARAATTFGPRREYVHFDEAVAAELLERLEHGRSLAEVCQERDMPSCATVHRWRAERPAFEAAYLKAREAQAERLFDLAWRIACEAEENEVKTARLKMQAIRWRIARLAPRAYGPQRAAPAEGGAGGERVVTSFVARRFGRTPEGRLVEITDLIRGLTDAEADELRRGLREGRVQPGDLPPPPDWLGVEGRLREG